IATGVIRSALRLLRDRWRHQHRQYRRVTHDDACGILYPDAILACVGRLRARNLNRRAVLIRQWRAVEPPLVTKWSGAANRDREADGIADADSLALRLGCDSNWHQHRHSRGIARDLADEIAHVHSVSPALARLDVGEDES